MEHEEQKDPVAQSTSVHSTTSAVDFSKETLVVKEEEHLSPVLLHEGHSTSLQQHSSVPDGIGFGAFVVCCDTTLLNFLSSFIELGCSQIVRHLAG